MDIGILALVGCILSVICIGLLAIVAYFGVRFLGGTASNIIRDVVDSSQGEDAPVYSTGAPRKRAVGPTRGRAVPADEFEAQVRQRLQNDNLLEPKGLSRHHGSALSAAQDEDPLGPTPQGDLRSQRTRRRDHDQEPYFDDWDMDGEWDIFEE
ncbi:hypothetical protein G4Y79_22050 [Phototrophicus methaneseepsis]|uniref:Uncharacterized protein n=1 Tax=Phototrophicus methaneseepsis TaxID=2710758 RepID=A0A7S8ID94_9CHLR|nr:hypothetical protein [Phototrophicus methaneseepsis]QPC82335.1 hypothetical protein G4Y79_22050 [Phototrophicus methaneseepsis]